MFRRGYIKLHQRNLVKDTLCIVRFNQSGPINSTACHYKSTLTETLETNLQAKQRENAWSSFNQLLTSGKESSIKTSQYSQLLDLIVSVPRVSSLERARGQKILLSMQKNQVRFTTCAEYAPLILFHAKNGRVDLFKRTLTEMKSQGIEPDASIYHQWIKGSLPRNLSSSLELINQMETSGVKPSLLTFEILLKAAREKKDVRMLAKIEEKMALLKIQKSPQTYYTLIENHARSSEVKKMEEVYAEMKESNVLPDLSTYNLMIRTYGKVRNSKQVLSVYNAMRVNGFRPTPSSYNYVAVSLASLSKLDEALELLAEMTMMGLRPDQVSYDFVIHELLNCSRSTDAFKLYQQALSAGSLLSVKTFTRLLHQKLRQKEKRDAIQIYEDMVKLGVTPDSRVFTVLVEVPGRLDCTDHIGFLWKEMQKYKVRMDDYLCNAFLNTCIRNSYIDLATEVFQEGVRLNRKLDRSVYRALVQLSLKDNKLATAKKVLQRLTSVTSLRELDVVTCTMVARAFAEQSDLEGVEMVHALIERDGIQLDNIALNTLLDSYSKCGKLEKVEELFQKHLEQGGHPPLDVVSYNIMIRGYTVRNRLGQASGLLDSMSNSGISPNTLTFNTLIDGYTRCGEMAQAERLMQRMERLNLPRNHITFNEVIYGYMLESDLEAATDSYKKMIALGIQPDVMTFDTLIHGCVNHSRFTQAQQWLDEMAKYEIHPTIETFNILMGGYLKAYRVDDALKVFDELSTRSSSQNIEPTVVTYSILMNCWSYSGKHENVLSVWEKLKSLPNFTQLDLAGSISVLLDSCGANGDLDELEKRWGEVNTLQVPLTENNHASYWEALVRLHQSEKAIEKLETWYRENGPISHKTGQVMQKLVLEDRNLTKRIQEYLSRVK